VRCPAPFSPTKSVLDLPQAVCVLSLVLVCLVPVCISLHVNGESGPDLLASIAWRRPPLGEENARHNEPLSAGMADTKRLRQPGQTGRASTSCSSWRRKNRCAHAPAGCPRWLVRAPIPRLRWDDPLVDDLLRSGEPCILTGGCPLVSSLVGRWDFEYLSRQFGETQLSVHFVRRGVTSFARHYGRGLGEGGVQSMSFAGFRRTLSEEGLLDCSGAGSPSLNGYNASSSRLKDGCTARSPGPLDSGAATSSGLLDGAAVDPSTRGSESRAAAVSSPSQSDASVTEAAGSAAPDGAFRADAGSSACKSDASSPAADTSARRSEARTPGLWRYYLQAPLLWCARCRALRLLLHGLRHRAVYTTPAPRP
jgi:hypothetical protein